LVLLGQQAVWHCVSLAGDDYEGLQMFRSGLLLRHDSSSSSSSDRDAEPGDVAAAEAPAVLQDTLLAYIYNEDDPVYKENFQHFLLAGVQPGSRCRCASLGTLAIAMVKQALYTKYNAAACETCLQPSSRCSHPFSKPCTSSSASKAHHSCRSTAAK
jgi:hypothetical protein